MPKILENIFCFVGLHDRGKIFSRTGQPSSFFDGWGCQREGCNWIIEPLDWRAPKSRTK